jgi:hypothetical protein
MGKSSEFTLNGGNPDKTLLRGTRRYKLELTILILKNNAAATL